MRKLITFAVVFIAATGVIAGQPSNNANRKPAEMPESAEARNALARLGELSLPALRERLRQMRPLNNLSRAVANHVIASQPLTIATGQRVDRLKAALQPVLAYHDRSRMPIYVVWSEQPKAYLVECAALFITTRMMTISTDEEIRGIVAHELAHEYVWQERLNAKQAKDSPLLRECEMFCDVVAAVTLKEIGDDPASYARILERMTIIGSAKGSATNKESATHPSLDARKKLNKFLCQRLD